MAEQPVVKAMRDGHLRPGEMRLLPTEKPPPTLHSRPILELLWFSAYHAAAQLAPWLSETSPYRLAVSSLSYATCASISKSDEP
jgi:hypothetical protein